MGQGIQACRRGDGRWQSEHQIGVEGNRHRQQGSAADHHLTAIALVGNDRAHGRLTPGSGGRGNGIERSGRCRRLVEARPGLGFFAGITGGGNDLGSIHGGAPAHCQNSATGLLTQNLRTFAHLSKGGVGLHAVIPVQIEAGFHQRCTGPVSDTQIAQRLVRYDENPFVAALDNALAQLVTAPCAHECKVG